MSESYREIALMCPQCQALVGGGSHDEETLRHIEGIAKTAGLTVLNMWCDMRQTEKCTCPIPSPLSRFATLVSLDPEIELETWRHGTKKWQKGLPDDWKINVPSAHDLKELSREDAEKEMRRVEKEISEKTGVGVRSIEDRDYDVKRPTGLPNDWEAIRALRIQGFDCDFVICASTDKDGFCVKVLTEHALQVFPPDPAECLAAKNRRLGLKHMDADVVRPFCERMLRVGPERFSEWLSINLEARAQKKEKV